MAMLGACVSQRPPAAGSVTNIEAMNTESYFDTPQQAVQVITALLKAQDWVALRRYYDLSDTPIERAQLESAAFFIRKERPLAAHPAGFWRYKQPFAPGFAHASHQMIADVVAQNSDIYFSTQANDQVEDLTLGDALGFVIKKELLSYHPKRWMRAYFESGTLLFNQEGRRLLKCSAGTDFFYLAPEGVVYPCLTVPSAMGDLKGHSFEELWESEQAERVRQEVDGCEKCWMICTARSSLKRNLHKALGWIAKEKIKTHLAN